MEALRIILVFGAYGMMLFASVWISVIATKRWGILGIIFVVPVFALLYSFTRQPEDPMLPMRLLWLSFPLWFVAVVLVAGGVLD